MNIQQEIQAAKAKKKINRAFFDRLKARTVSDLDSRFSDAHDEVFSKTDCLTCANCCKTTSPIFYERDIERAAAALRIKPGVFTQRYLRTDEEGDRVLIFSPCAFLNADNTCSIYESRPAACREYPHTNRRKMQQILDLTFRNTLVCPAVARIVDILRKEIT